MSRSCSAVLAVLAVALVGGSFATAAQADSGLAGRWTFDSATESTGQWGSLQLRGSAHLSNGELVVSGSGNGYDTASGWARATAYTGPALRDKTLVAWVKIDPAAPAMGGPLSLNTTGDVFDSIVYGEAEANRWMAGSDHWHRTQRFVPGATDLAPSTVLRQVVISYRGVDGGSQTITGCLNGIALGAYRASSTAIFPSAGTVAVFGPRHTVGPMYERTVASMTGRIDEARVYDHAIPCVDAADTDADKVLARADNCPGVSNAGQTDTDRDSRGDACDSTPNGDTDADGVDNSVDNCPGVSNPGQENVDGYADTQGDACDSDADNDGVEDLGDNCRETSNPGQENTGVAEDNLGDACDDDADNDGIVDAHDNCPDAANTDQANFDRSGGDREGDACDGDIDGDGTPNAADAFDFDATEDTDTDGDGIGDNSDPYPTVDAREDADNDGIPDGTDNCVTTPNSDQANLDRDDEGDACDGDRDGDGVANDVDNAPNDANAAQTDLDSDGTGDVIDTTVLPRHESQCKKDGWRRFYDGTVRFSNQGDCVSFVATGGKNLPVGI